MAGAKIYPKGIVTFNPKDSQPAFALGDIVININQLNEWLKGDGAEYLTDYKGEPQIRLSLTSLKEKRGISLSVNTWKPDASFKPTEQHTEAKEQFAKREVVDNFRVPDTESDLPFALFLICTIGSLAQFIF